MTEMGRADYLRTRDQLLFLARFIPDIDLVAFINYPAEAHEIPSGASPEARSKARARIAALRWLAHALKPLKAQVEKQRAEGVSHE